jgi:hypothetical protein
VTKFFSVFFIVALSTIFTSIAAAAEVYSVDMSVPIEFQLSLNCPWVSVGNLQKVVIAENEKIGWTGGDLGEALGDLFGNSTGDVNYTNVAANIPPYSRAILLDTQYFNNNGQAQIIVEELSLISVTGDKYTMHLSDKTRVLSQMKGQTGEAILICFTNDEEYVRVSAQVTHQNVDGSRPTMGISAFTDENIVFLK